MSFQDPTGDTLTTGGASVPPLVGYGADSTLNTNSGGDAIPTGMATPFGGTPGMGAPDPTSAPQQFGSTQRSADDLASELANELNEPEGVAVEVTEVDVEALDDESWNLRRTGLIAGVVAAGLAAGAGAAWFFINRRRAQRARQAAVAVAQVAQARRLFSMLPAQVQAQTAKQAVNAARALVPAQARLANATTTSATLTRRAGQSARDASAATMAMAASALAAAQDARDRALAASQMLLDQTTGASQVAQDRFNDTWGRTRDTAAVSWDAANKTAKVARNATLHTADVTREAFQQAMETARAESKRTAKSAQAGWRRAQRTATH